MTTDGKPPVLLLHGVFGSPSLIEPWARYLREAGYVCHVPTFPGREPTDDRVLARTGVAECLEVALRAYDEIGEPAIVIGHSFGGFVAQKVAAARDCVALVLLASVLGLPVSSTHILIGAVLGFGLSPASGHAIQQLVTDGACSFADLSTLRLSRFAHLEPDWAALQGWQSMQMAS